MPNLFEIAAEIMACIKREDSDEYINTLTGEILDVEALDALKMERDTKLRNIGCFILNLDAEEKMLAEQEKHFKERKDAVKRKKESLKNYVGAFLQGKAWKCVECEFKFRTSESVAFNGDIYKVPEDYLRYKEPELDRNKIKKALKEGIQIPGCSIETKTNVSVK